MCESKGKIKGSSFEVEILLLLIYPIALYQLAYISELHLTNSSSY